MEETFTGMEDIDINAMDQEIEEELKTTVTLAIQTEVLKTLIGKVERSVAKKAVQDVYKMIYLDFQPTCITARAINNDYVTEAFVAQNEDATNFKITGGKPGSICFPADKLVPIVKRLASKNSSITIRSNKALFKSGRPEFDLIGIDGSEFPRIPSIENSQATITIHPNVLSMIYDRTIYAASTKETRPILTGVHHQLSGNRLICVATDSHRLAQFVYDLNESYDDIAVTIPTTVLSEAKKHLDATEAEVSIHLCSSQADNQESNQVVYQFNDVTLFARVLNGTYPPTGRLIFAPEQAGSSFTVHAGNFKTLLNNSTVYNPDQPIIIRIKPHLGQLRVNTREADVGAFQEDLAVNDGVGADVVLAVNVRYMQEAFARYNNDDYVTLEFMPSADQKPSGMQPFKARLKNGNEDCVELFVPVRTDQVKYNEEVIIDDFKGVPEFDFNPFEADFEGIE